MCVAPDNYEHHKHVKWHISGEILPSKLFPSRNLLEGTGNDEISVIHSYNISCELAREVILIVELLPVYIGIWIFCFLQGMSNGALSDSKSMCQ